MDSMQEYQSTESSSTVCPSIFDPNVEDGDQKNPPLSFAFSKVSEKSSSTRIIQYINHAAYIERPYEESISALDDVEDFDSKTFPCLNERADSSPYSGSSTKVQLCKVVDNPEEVQLRKERYEEWLKNKK